MTYAPPQVTSAGLSIPGFADIEQNLLAQFQGIYGSNFYLGNESPWKQFIDVIALAISDTMQLGQLDYNNRSPVFAIGAALDTLVEINGLVRKAASFSTCAVNITGTAGTVITNGVVEDINGNLWSLPSPVTIGVGGTVTVTAVCQIAGQVNITAPSQIVTIFTPTAGWVSVNNGSNVASLGQPMETDGQLRARQFISTELPSITILAGTIAAIAATPGVTRYNVDENFTNATNSNGNPAHSVTAVVEGGTDLAVATAIFNNRGIGPLTNDLVSGSPVSGSRSIPITDPNTNITINIGFLRPADVPIFVIVNAHLLAGGTTATLTAIQTAVTNYLNSLQIGAPVNYTSLIAAAMSVNPNPSQPIVRVETLFFATTATPTTTADIILTFNQVAQGIAANVAVNSV